MGNDTPQVIDLTDVKNPVLVSVVERVTADMASHVAVDCATPASAQHASKPEVAKSKGKGKGHFSDCMAARVKVENAGQTRCVAQAAFLPAMSRYIRH